MSSQPPAWLSEFQAAFGQALRTPLDRSSGSLAASAAGYPAPLLECVRATRTLSAVERLAVYNRQYWFRLFTVLQDAFPLTARLFGFWEFNELAAQFLVGAQLKSWDVETTADGFEVFIEQRLASSPQALASRAAIEAAHIDAAYFRVFRAPAVELYRPTAASLGDLSTLRLRPAPSWALVEEHWPLIELRLQLLADSGERRVALPAPYGENAAEGRAWLVFRKRAALAQLPVGPLEVRLLGLLQSQALGPALAALEAGCSPEERSALPAWTQRWLARSIELEMWAAPPA